MLSKDPSPFTNCELVPPVVMKAEDSIVPVRVNVNDPLLIVVFCVRDPPSLTGCPGDVCIIPF